jgi:O-antigen/teichoic acid export membrane protein
VRALLGRLSKHTAIYGIGTMAQSLVQLVLLPMYTRVLTQEQYGTLALLLSMLAVLEVAFRAGVHFALLTLYFHQPDEDARERLRRTAWTALALHATLMAGLLAVGGPTVIHLLGGPADMVPALLLILVYLLASTPTVVRLSLHRSRDQSGAFILLNASQLALTLVANLVLVLGMRLGVVGVFLGYAIAGTLVGTVSAVRLLRDHGLGVDWSQCRELYRLGLSYTLANLLSQGLVYSNRWFLVGFGSLRDVALFDLGYKVGMILQLLVISPFSVAWATGLFAVAGSEQPRRNFALLFSYLLALLAWVGLGLNLFARELLLVVGGGQYQEAWAVVPYTVTGYILFGAYAFLTMGPALKKRSQEIVAATLAAIVTNVGLNWLLIPIWGVQGAAAASTLSFLSMTVAMYVGAQNCYPVDYEGGRLARVAVAYGLLSLAGIAAGPTSVATVLLRLAIVIAFPAVLWALGFYEDRELAFVREVPRRLLARWRDR